MSVPVLDNARQGVSQAIAFTGSSVAITNAFGAQTYYVELCANSHCHYRIGDGAQTAATTDSLLPAYTVITRKVSPGQRISAIRGATDGLVTATSGTLTVTELTV